MTTITRISETKRGRYALFEGDAFLFSLSVEVFADSDLHEGDVLDADELDNLRRHSDTRAAMDAAMRYLSRRAYAERELYEKLLQKHDEHSAAAAVGAACAAGLMDDAQYAVEKAEVLAKRGKSVAEIRRRLCQAGVDDALATQTVQDLNVNETEAALQWVRRSYAEKLAKGQRQQVMAALARRGFAHGDIVRAVEAAEREMNTVAASPEDV